MGRIVDDRTPKRSEGLAPIYIALLFSGEALVRRINIASEIVCRRGPLDMRSGSEVVEV
jgi:hypothetical protein